DVTASVPAANSTPAGSAGGVDGVCARTAICGLYRLACSASKFRFPPPAIPIRLKSSGFWQITSRAAAPTDPVDPRTHTRRGLERLLTASIFGTSIYTSYRLESTQ